MPKISLASRISFFAAMVTALALGVGASVALAAGSANTQSGPSTKTPERRSVTRERRSATHERGQE